MEPSKNTQAARRQTEQEFLAQCDLNWEPYNDAPDVHYVHFQFGKWTYVTVQKDTQSNRIEYVISNDGDDETTYDETTYSEYLRTTLYRVFDSTLEMIDSMSQEEYYANFK